MKIAGIGCHGLDNYRNEELSRSRTEGSVTADCPYLRIFRALSTVQMAEQFVRQAILTTYLETG